MKDIPIIFSAPMVNALLSGRKTMTRRLAWRAVSVRADGARLPKAAVALPERPGIFTPSPWQSVEPGDRLWVRESLAQRAASFLGVAATNGTMEACYAADGEDVVNEHDFNLCPWWKGDGGLPSIHMPRRVSRLTLTVTAKKVERLQDISEADAKAEGWTPHPEVSADPEVHRDAARDWFSDLWTDLHGVESWRSNPEVVALSFKVVRQNIDGIE